jgi:hypothetical protein
MPMQAFAETGCGNPRDTPLSRRERAISKPIKFMSAP